MRRLWEIRAREQLCGKTVKQVRFMERVEVDDLMWNEAAVVIEFDDGTMIFPSQDEEGNGAGALFGQAPNGEEMDFPAIRL